MTLQAIASLVNEALDVSEKLSLTQVAGFLSVISQDIDLAEHVLGIIQKCHGIGLEGEPADHPDTPTASE